MKLSCIPAELFLESSPDGFVVMLKGVEVFRHKVQKTAIAKFNALRAEYEKQYPTREWTQEEKLEALKHEVNDSLVGHNSLGGRKNWNKSASGTRTFGG